MEIIKFINPKTKSTEKYINFSDGEKASITTVISVLRELEKVCADPRDSFEFRYSAKFLSMVQDLKNTANITQNIDAMLMDEEILGDISEIDKSMGYDFGDVNINDIIREIRDAVDSFMGQGVINDPSKRNKKNIDKQKKKKKDKYDQIEIDFTNPEDENE